MVLSKKHTSISHAMKHAVKKVVGVMQANAMECFSTSTYVACGMTEPISG